MGHFKNQLIAEQVELGDRVPAPKPAASHVAWDTRRNRRAWREARVERRRRARYRIAGYALTGAFYGVLTGFVAGVLVGMVV